MAGKMVLNKSAGILVTALVTLQLLDSPDLLVLEGNSVFCGCASVTYKIILKAGPQSGVGHSWELRSGLRK